ncbi:MAG: hypothetical protein HY941_10360 [Gammaproteobacteria bacterium]|nr:hypothetical protein [Gammaproteobacteria bacterium]
MMTKNSRRRWVLAGLGALLVALPGFASAACSMANLRGTWYAVGVSGDTQLGHMDETVRCKIVVSSSGAIPATGSACYVRDYTGLSTVSIPSGSLSVSSACAVTGTLRMCRSGSCYNFRVQHAQMARDWNTFSLVGYSQSNPDIVSFFDAVKR